MTPRLMKPNGKIKREARDLAVYTDYQELMSVEGQSKTAVTQYLMDKYGIDSPSTIYLIRKRVEQRMREEVAV